MKEKKRQKDESLTEISSNIGITRNVLVLFRIPAYTSPLGKN